MRKITTLFFASVLLVFSMAARADGHGSHANAGPLFYGQSIGLIASDPPAVLAAMNKWRATPSGQKAPNTVVLLQNIVNGDYQSTHGVNIFYQNGAAMDGTAQLYVGNADWAEFQESLRAVARPEWENTYAIIRAKVRPGDISSPNPASIVYGLTVTDPEGFMGAFDAMWNSDVVQNFPGAVYLGQTMAAGTMPGTHFVTFVGNSRGQLTEAIMQMQSTEAMSAYLEAAEGTRKVEAINMFSEVKRWTNGG